MVHIIYNNIKIINMLETNKQKIVYKMAIKKQSIWLAAY